MDREIQTILVQHYRNILHDLQDELRRVEDKLDEIDQHKETSEADKSLIRKKRNSLKGLRIDCLRYYKNPSSGN